MLLFSVFEFAIFISELGLLLLELPFGDLPEGADSVTLQLEVVSFFPLAIEFFADATEMIHELFRRHLHATSKRESHVRQQRARVRRFTSAAGRPSMIVGPFDPFFPFFFFPPFFFGA